MAGSLMLSTKRAQAPYYIDELGLSIYTMEELCYYIYNYLEFLDDTFISEELLTFIGKSMGLDNLSEKIIRWINGGSDFGQIIFMIEQDIHYLSGNELNDLKARLEWRRTAKPADRLKKKADTLVALKKYRLAIIIYDEILDNERGYGLSIRTKGTILHNRGAVYARLLMFKDAADNIEKAYPMLDSPDILKELYFLYYLDKEAVGERSILTALSDEIKSAWKKEIEDIIENAGQYGRYGSIIEASNQDSKKKAVFFEELVKQWKKEYRNMVK